MVGKQVEAAATIQVFSFFLSWSREILLVRRTREALTATFLPPYIKNIKILVLGCAILWVKLNSVPTSNPSSVTTNKCTWNCTRRSEGNGDEQLDRSNIVKWNVAMNYNFWY